MEYKDYYVTLGLDRKASADDIKHAYRRLARKYHPDVSKEKNAEEKFKDVQEAYEVLKDPEKRAAYDQLGSNWKSGQEFRPPPGWDQGSHFQGGQGFGQFSEEDLGGFSDFFANLFGGGGARMHTGRHAGGRGGFEGYQQRGQDQHATIKITLEEAYHGSTKTLQMQMPEREPSGAIVYQTRTLKVTIPPGVKQGQQLRLTGQGAPGMGGAPAGDVYLEIELLPNKRFTLKGSDVYLTLPLTPWEAALGATIKVPTLGGAVDLKIPPGSQSAQQLRLKGKGMPHKPTPGNQYVVLQVFVPPAHTEAQRQLYENMAQSMPFNPRPDWPV